MDFFSGCNTKEQARSTFKKLCKCFHPDKGGDEALMIELKKQYDNWHPSGSTTSYSSDPGLIHVYERRLNEQSAIVFKLREEIDLYRRTGSVNEEILRAERQAKYRAENEVREMKVRFLELRDQFDELKNKIISQEKMTMMDKVRFVFGYD